MLLRHLGRRPSRLAEFIIGPAKGRTRWLAPQGDGQTTLRQSMLEKIKKSVRKLPPINTSSDTRDILSHATRQAKQHSDYFLVDIDAHVTETQFWPEILASIDNEFIRHMGEAGLDRPVSRSLALLNNVPGMSYQSVYGRIPHEQARLEAIPGKDCHPCVALVRRAMDALGLDYQILFPTPMLTMGMHPQDDVEVALGVRSTNGWSSASCRRTSASRACCIFLSTRRKRARRWSRSTRSATKSSASPSVRRATSRCTTIPTCGFIR
jgi:hypothetical protein